MDWRLTGISWKRESDLRRHHRTILLYWAGIPDQCGAGVGRPYLAMGRFTVARELHREHGKGFIAKSECLVPQRQSEPLSADASKLRGANIWFKNLDDRR